MGVSRSLPTGLGARRQRGFTLIELLVTVGVMAILLSVALPSFQGVINGNRLTSAANDTLGVLQHARMEAIRRNARVVACPSTNGTSCSTAGAWGRFIVFVDDGGGNPTNRGNNNRDANEEILRDFTTSDRIQVRASASITGTAGGNRIVFRGDGFARQGVGSALRTSLTGAVQVCIDSGRPQLNARDISIQGSRIAVRTPARNAGCEGAPDNA